MSYMGVLGKFLIASLSLGATHAIYQYGLVNVSQFTNLNSNIQIVLLAMLAAVLDVGFSMLFFKSSRSVMISIEEFIELVASYTAVQYLLQSYIAKFITTEHVPYKKIMAIVLSSLVGGIIYIGSDLVISALLNMLLKK